MTPVPAGAGKSTKNVAVHDRQALVDCMPMRLIDWKTSLASLAGDVVRGRSAVTLQAPFRRYAWK